MNRKEFLKTCGYGCLAGVTGMTLLQSCSSSQVLTRKIEGSDIIVPIADFEIRKHKRIDYKKYVIVQNDLLKFPICVYRSDADNYQALLMQCTHQGAELQVFGERLQCPAHGSEFNSEGGVENGPADNSLRKFPITILNNSLKISLK